MNLHGIFAPITTPFTAGGESIAFDRLRQNLAVYDKTRLAGYAVCGSTGEAILLTWDETERLFAAVAEHNAKRKILIAGTGVESTSETIHRTKRAAELGYNAALVRTPHYYKPAMTHTALLDYYRRVADASPIPILVYSIPQFTGVEVPGALVARLAEHPNICGIKDSWGKLNVVQEIIAAAPKSFQTLVGAASIVDASLKLGAVGAILGVSCIAPDLCAALYDAAHAGDSAKTEEIQKKVTPVATKCVNEFGVAGTKFSMDALAQSGGHYKNFYGGPTRSPLLPLTAAQQSEVKSALATLSGAAALASAD
ncbi:MAG TPA: dihydrodipicolinate synthase family protein [Candidatus Acidoferrum sp.]|nr:dihydrodipicolinate synthase family protein [Candidatus Acidoferrum sp.]